MSTEAEHERMMTALREQTFERLGIRRLGSQCYLLVTRGGETHVFVDRHGRQKTYRHAWQVREWLENSFGIHPATVGIVKPG